MGDQSAPVQEKAPEKPTEIQSLPGNEAGSQLGDFARALTWTRKAFQINDGPSVIDNEKSVIINYPEAKGSATILKDENGPLKIFRDGQVLLERLSKPGASGECRWLVMNNQEMRGTFTYDKTGMMRFLPANGDVYTFSADGEKKITRAKKTVDAAAAPEAKKELCTAQDLLEWMKTGLPLLDENKDGGLSLKELQNSLNRTDLSATDAAFVASLIRGFSIIDSQAQRDGKITPADAAGLMAASLNPMKREQLDEINKMFAATFMRMKDKSDKLFGEFKDPRDAIKSDAVGQGFVGDCWFMGSVAALADTRPELIEKMIKDNANGTYTVTFPGQPDKPYTVKAPTNLEMALYARGSQYGTWVSVLEKAAARAFEKEKFYNKSEIEVSILNGGTAEEAFALLTGLTPIQLDMNAPNLHSVLSTATQWQLPVAAGSFIELTDSDADENGVYGTHLYTLKYDPVKREIIVRNPWGWTPKSEPHYPNGAPLDGVADGAFRLTLAQFRKSFRTVTTVIP